MLNYEYLKLIRQGSLQDIYDVFLDMENWQLFFDGSFDVSNISVLGEIEAGSKVSMRLSRFNFVCDSEFEIESFSNNEIVYRQTKGIFKKWHHSISWKKNSSNRIEMLHKVKYKLPLGIIGTLFQDLFFKFDLPDLLKSQTRYIERKVKETNH